jgi:hypothetical protein
LMFRFWPMRCLKRAVQWKVCDFRFESKERSKDSPFWTVRTLVYISNI